MKKYTQDWFSSNIGAFQFFKSYDGPNKKYLEVGSFEGMSMCWMMDNILKGDNDLGYAVDTFEGGREHSGLNMSEVESNFLHNTEDYRNKVIICKGRSDEQLIKLYEDHKESFDFAYIDGSHDAWDVLSDAVLVFKLVKKGGIIGFDDYGGGHALHSPKPAIDAFLHTHQNFIKILHSGYQVWIEKL